MKSRVRSAVALSLASFCIIFIVSNTTLNTIEDETYSYSEVPTQSQGQYSYSAGNQEGAPATYTYTVQASDDKAGSYTYDTTAYPDESGFYTYSTTQPGTGGSGVTTYFAEPAPQQMTVINGYATKPQEQWNTVPIGTLHPLDTAGKWESGTFDSINPDGTTRVMAPLTLSGERQDGAVASDARRKTTTGLMNFPSRSTMLKQVDSGSIFSTPVSKVMSLSPKDQKRWADHVLAMRRKEEIFSASPKQVLTMTQPEQKLWAEHTMQEYKHKLASKSAKRWADQVEKLLHLHKNENRGRHAVDRGIRRQKQSHSQDQHILTNKAKTRKAASFDAFGFLELKSPASRIAPIESRHQISESLRTHRKCDDACLQLAQSLARNELPV